ncbi:unnamed protein product [Orchesella dallaii]|uniref:Protein NATD1 n=1 Tax=Orchesella dallaii TaxID=48710 RepID=A0ABP1PNU3_9HEXA
MCYLCDTYTLYLCYPTPHVYILNIMSLTSHLVRQFRFSPVSNNAFRSMSSAMDLKVEHDTQNKKFFIKLGDVEAKLEYAKNDLNGNTVLDMWHTEVPPQLQGKGIAKILAQEAFNYVVDNNLKMQLSCSYLQKYLKDNPLDKYKSAVA